ncbi:hypothetical protein N9L20_02810 [Flavobacteriaceae bacterium]|nr:hypothetical protein [Flavobacteriaceae bacterium]
MKRVLLVVPDGVGLRNYIYSDFIKKCKVKGLNVYLMSKNRVSQTDIDVIDYKLNVTSIGDLLKSILIRAELVYFSKYFNDITYLSYIKSNTSKRFKVRVKTKIVHVFGNFLSSKVGILVLRRSLRFAESKSSCFKENLNLLAKLNIDKIVCSSQRSGETISIIEAGKSMGIPTYTNIYSWDNPPKAMLINSPDYIFVWSQYMKNELLKHYPNLSKSSLLVTGTPQFEYTLEKPNFDILNKKYGFSYNPTTKYICFSGDDITTSPYDQLYLNDLAELVRDINRNEDTREVKIIFRRCPVDFSDRYNEVLDKFNEEIIVFNPVWANVGSNWNSVIPMELDNEILNAITSICSLVVNVGSTMAFDFALKNKPAAYINYNPKNIDLDLWRIEKIYKYIHFRSMPNKDCINWVNSKNDFYELIENTDSLNLSNKWLKVINENILATNKIIDYIDTNQ